MIKVLIIIPIFLMSIPKTIKIFDFHSSADISQWLIINDGVMGGLSKGQFEINESGNAVFHGFVSLENNGGFSSVRYRLPALDVEQYEKIVIRVKGDGKRYQLRVKTRANDRHSYIEYFQTKGNWQEFEIKFSSMYPSFRGRKLNMPNYSGQIMSEVTFLIANNKAESFHLEIDDIELN